VTRGAANVQKLRHGGIESGVAEPALVATRETDENLELVVNFGMFAGRDATAAEVERLARALLDDLESVEIVCEHRYEFDREREGSVYQVRVVVPREGERLAGELVETTEAWAADCIADRRFLSP
jgi:hypothetical protein